MSLVRQNDILLIAMRYFLVIAVGDMTQDQYSNIVRISITTEMQHFIH